MASDFTHNNRVVEIQQKIGGYLNLPPCAYVAYSAALKYLLLIYCNF